MFAGVKTSQTNMGNNENMNIISKKKTFRDCDNSGKLFIICSCSWISTFFAISLIIFIVTGSVALGFGSERNQWNQSDCLVNNIQSTSQPISQNCVDGTCSIGYVYNLIWNVTYFNSIAKRKIQGELVMYGNQIDNAKALLAMHPLNSTSPCVFRNQDFSLAWDLPFPNTNYIIYTAISFGILSFLLFIGMIFIQLKFRYCNEFTCQDC